MYSSAVSLLFCAATVSRSAALPDGMVGRALRGLVGSDGLSREEVRCTVDSQALYGKNPDLQQILLTVNDNIEVSVNDNTDSMDLSFKQGFLTDLEAACKDASGLFVYLNETDFLCSYMGQEVAVDVDNFVQCLADTPECRGLDQVKFLEEIWDSLDLQCREIREPAAPKTSKPYYSSSGSSISTSNGGQPKSYSAGVLAAKVSFVALCAGAVAYFIRRSEGQQRPSPASYEMSTQEDRILT